MVKRVSVVLIEIFLITVFLISIKPALGYYIEGYVDETYRMPEYNDELWRDPRESLGEDKVEINFPEPTAPQANPDEEGPRDIIDAIIGWIKDRINDIKNFLGLTEDPSPLQQTNVLLSEVLLSDINAIISEGKNTGLENALIDILSISQTEDTELLDNPPYLFRTVYGLTQEGNLYFTGIKVNKLFLSMPPEIRKAILIHEANHIKNIELRRATLLAQREFELATGISDIEEGTVNPDDFHSLVESVKDFDSQEIEKFKRYFALKVQTECLAWVDELSSFKGEDFDRLITKVEGLPNPQAREMSERLYTDYKYLFNYSTHHGDLDGFDARRLKLAIVDYFFSRDLLKAYIIAILIEKKEHQDRTIGDIRVVNWGDEGYALRIEHREGRLVEDSVGLTPVPADEYLDYLTNPSYYTLALTSN